MELDGYKHYIKCYWNSYSPDIFDAENENEFLNALEMIEQAINDVKRAMIIGSLL